MKTFCLPALFGLLLLAVLTPWALAQSASCCDASVTATYSPRVGNGLSIQETVCDGSGLPKTPVQIGEGLFIQAPTIEQLQVQPQMIGNSRQYAPVYEAIYAMRQSEAVAYGPPNANAPLGGPIWGDAVSNWNYLADDPNAFSTVSRLMGSNSSVSNYFGLGNGYALQSGYGRGGQCTFFATLILYRALNGYLIMSHEGYNSGWYYGNPALNNCPSALSAQPGDVVFYKSGGAGHVAIAVQRFSNNTLAVIDSNWVGYGYSQYSVGVYASAYNSEIIGCHVLSVSDQQYTYKVYSGRGRWY